MEKQTLNRQRPSRVEKEELAYFKPTEMVFVISHPTDDVPTKQQMDRLVGDRNGGGVIGWSNENKTDDALMISRVRGRELHFRGSTQLPDPPKLDIDMPEGIHYQSPELVRRTAFSLIPIEVRVAATEDNPEGLVDTNEFAKLIISFDEKRGSLEKTLNGERVSSQMVTVEAVSPNWFSSPAMSEYGGGGGPGSRPVPYTGKPGTARSEFILSSKVKQLCPEYKRRGQDVKVAILDTAPCLHDLVEAYELYHKVRPERYSMQRQEVGPHHLIESLLRPGGPLHLHPASIEELYRMRAVHLRDHDYIMTDHGLFVAGIIHSIAPAAELHLYEVLNPQGAGDLESIARGLWELAEEQYDFFMREKKYQPLIVNCSLMLYIPLDGDPDNPDTAKVLSLDGSPTIVGHRLTDMHEDIRNYLSNDSEWGKRSASVIMWICDLLYILGSRVIAAAGNDWDPEDNGRPQARYPAAFESVQGVGALKKEQSQAAIAQNASYEVASYSDLSDRPGKVGVATLGGEPGEGRGVLGIYLGDFPEPPPEELPILQRVLKWLVGLSGGKFVYPKNQSHWAWWAGTSFATPILSGVVASVLSKPAPPPTTEGAIVELYKTRAIEDSRTDYMEDLLNVTQG